MLEKTRQYVSALSILLFAVCVGLPIWWKTTEVYRCPLPYKEIGALASQQVPPLLAFRVSIVDLGCSKGGLDIDALAQSVEKQLGSTVVSSNSAIINIQYKVKPKTLSPEIIDELSHALTTPEEFSALAVELFPTTLDHFIVFLAPPPHSTTLIGQHRHAVLPLTSQPQLTHSLVELVGRVFGDLNQLEKTLRTATGKLQDRVDVESMRQLRASLGYQISFTLVNPDPSQLQESWDIEDATESMLVPFLSHSGISALGNFTINSQVFYFTDAKFKPRKDGSNFFVSPLDLPPMISSVESKLASHVSQLPSLNFIVYLPRPTEQPLLIRTGKKTSTAPPPPPPTDTFLVPQWGGVVIFNPLPATVDMPGNETDAGEADQQGRRRVDVKMERIMAMFIAQLKMLLGLPPIDFAASKDLSYLTGRFGVTDWQVDQLLTSKMVESVSMATTSLISLVQLLDKVKNMVISDHIQQEVETSLQALQECYSYAAGGEMEAAYDAAKRAMDSAETAFFDPSILELLYFPDDQKFAIYIPLFVPISVPILLSSATALKWVGGALRGRSTTSDRAKRD